MAFDWYPSEWEYATSATLGMSVGELINAGFAGGQLWFRNTRVRQPWQRYFFAMAGGGVGVSISPVSGVYSEGSYSSTGSRLYTRTCVCDQSGRNCTGTRSPGDLSGDCCLLCGDLNIPGFMDRGGIYGAIMFTGLRNRGHLPDARAFFLMAGEQIALPGGALMAYYGQSIDW